MINTNLIESLKKESTLVFLLWKSLLPEDPEGKVLIEHFLESKEFLDEGQENLNKAFRLFSRRLFEGKKLNKKDKWIGPYKTFHIHRYLKTMNNLRGPHPRDQKSEQMDASELSSFILKHSCYQDSILIHPVTDNELFDHTLGAIWIGPKLPLDLSKLDF